jgi:hypothetical protein
MLRFRLCAQQPVLSSSKNRIMSRLEAGAPGDAYA